MLGPLVQGYMDMTADAQGVEAADIIAGIAKNWPIPDMPLDENVAESIVFLLSDRSRMITGDRRAPRHGWLSAQREGSHAVGAH